MNQGQSTLIIAEAGVNHNGSLEMAKSLVDEAKRAGADVIKFQTFKAASIVSKSAPKADYQIQQTGADESQFEMIEKLELDEAAHATLISHCGAAGIQFLSTPFDRESLDLLAGRFGLSVIKLPSGEITNAPLLLWAAQYGRPIILSTGMATLGEVEAALGVLAFGYMHRHERPTTQGLQEAFCSEEGQALLRERVTLLHCTTEYPAPLGDVNLRAMQTLRSAFGLRVGYSDHTQGISVAVAAVALGATIIEKHFTLNRSLPGPDHQASLQPVELGQMVRAIREVEVALGSDIKRPVAAELTNRIIARKSLVAARDILKGEEFTEESLGVKRPGGGTSPFRYWDYLGRKAERNYSADEVIE